MKKTKLDILIYVVALYLCASTSFLSFYIFVLASILKNFIVATFSLITGAVSFYIFFDTVKKQGRLA